MTKITCYRDKGDVTISLKGHAQSGPFGEDIVCAYLSGIIQTALLGLENVADQYPEYIDFEYIDKINIKE